MAETANFKLKLIDFDKIPWGSEAHDNLHVIDALMARYISLSNVQGVYQNATAVTVGQRYIDSADDTIYEVLIAHTTPSTGTFTANRLIATSNWSQNITVTATFRGAWAASTVYASNDFVTDGARYGVVATAHTAITSYDVGVTAGNIVTLIDGNTIISSSPIATGLSVGASPTVTYNSTTGVFTFGIPVGATGAAGSATSDPELNAIAGLVSAADRVPFFTGSGTAALATFTGAGRALVDDANAGDQRTTLGLAIGTDVAAQSHVGSGGASHADAIAAGNDGFMTGSDKTKIDGVSSGAEVNPAVVSQSDAEAGSATDERIWTAERVKQAIAALGASVIKEMFIPAAFEQEKDSGGDSLSPLNTSALAGNDFPMARLGSGDEADDFAAIGWFVPSDFSSITDIKVVVNPKVSQASADWDLSSSFGAIGESPAASTGANTASTYNVSISVLFEVDASGIFSGLAAGDYAAIRFECNNDSHDLELFGVRFKYT